ncbi:unnamed protein product [Zymoseptoria tritici ST99CH_3D1]|nr:unnamed protein product [Zymoseptoria tritici ST99CH_3D1]
MLDLTGPMRTVVVGQEPYPPFLLHHNILCKSSQLFASKMTWPEAVELPTSNYEAFRVYCSWLYAGRIPRPQDDIYMEQISWPLLAHAFALGEAIKDYMFKDLIIDYMHEMLAWNMPGMKFFYESYSSEVVAAIYNNTLHGSPARVFINQVCTNYGPMTSAWLEHRRHLLPNDFIFDMAILMARAMSGQPLARLSDNKCTYHSHPIDVDDEVCANDCARAAA